MVVAGFGWSAGDIAIAIKVIYKVTNAFKETGGAAERYQDALGFLHSLETTLKHLETHAGASPSDPYSADIKEQLDRIDHPWKDFEKCLAKFDKSLSGTSTRHKLGKAPRTVQYTIKELCGDVEKLKVAVAQPLQVVNHLLSLQIVHEIKLVPQKLLTPQQLQQLRGALYLADAPVDVQVRLKQLQTSLEANIQQLRDDVVLQMHGLMQWQALLRHDLPQATAMLLSSTSGSSTQIASAQTASTAIAGCSDDEVNFRLKVEDHHWSVIKLFQALNTRLDEISHGLSTTTDCASSLGMRDAILLLAASTGTGVLTGVIVGRSIATAGHAASHAAASAPYHATISVPFTATSHPLYPTQPPALPARFRRANPVHPRRPQEVAKICPRDSPSGNVPDKPSALIPAPQPTLQAGPGWKSYIPSIFRWPNTAKDVNEKCSKPEVICTSDTNSKPPDSRAPPSTIPVGSGIDATRALLGPRARSSISHAAIRNRNPRPPTNRPSVFPPPHVGAAPNAFKRGLIFAVPWKQRLTEMCETSERLGEVPYVNNQACIDFGPLPDWRYFVALQTHGSHCLCIVVGTLFSTRYGDVPVRKRTPHEYHISWPSGTSDGSSQRVTVVARSKQTHEHASNNLDDFGQQGAQFQPFHERNLASTHGPGTRDNSAVPAYRNHAGSGDGGQFDSSDLPLTMTLASPDLAANMPLHAVAQMKHTCIINHRTTLFDLGYMETSSLDRACDLWEIANPSFRGICEWFPRLDDVDRKIAADCLDARSTEGFDSDESDEEVAFPAIAVDQRRQPSFKSLKPPTQIAGLAWSNANTSP